MNRVSKLLAAIAALAILVAAANGASAGIVINEGYGGGGNNTSVYTHDFIELYNNTFAPIDISGYQLNYASATGAFTPGATETQFITIIPANTPTVPAGGFFLIQEAQGAGGSVGLPSPNLVDTTPIAMASGAFKVQLLDSANVVQDLVGVGSTASAYEGAGAAPGTSNPTSAQRLVDGLDTNNNNLDFGVGTPTPGAANVVPEPTALALLSLGGIASLVRRSRNK
jgi:predicted extracellular nuclease